MNTYTCTLMRIVIIKRKWLMVLDKRFVMGGVGGRGFEVRKFPNDFFCAPNPEPI